MNKRQTKILELLTQNKKIEVTKLSELLGVSQVTIRKDLDALSESFVTSTFLFCVSNSKIFVCRLFIK